LHGVPFHNVNLDGEFLHLGTTEQFRDAMIGANPSPAAELLQQNVLTHSNWKLSKSHRVYHSVLLDGSRSKTQSHIGTGVVIEHSLLRSPCKIGAGSVVSQAVAMRS